MTGSFERELRKAAARVMALQWVEQRLKEQPDFQLFWQLGVAQEEDGIEAEDDDGGRGDEEGLDALEVGGEREL
jgi:hypothetical protein